ncbi:unnamed protein product, partial [Ectocarpus sp. 4 AP-2014]
MTTKGRQRPTEATVIWQSVSQVARPCFGIRSCPKRFGCEPWIHKRSYFPHAFPRFWRLSLPINTAVPTVTALPFPPPPLLLPHFFRLPKRSRYSFYPSSASACFFCGGI